MLWSGWGDPQQAVALAPQTDELLRAALGITHAAKPVAFENVHLPAPRLDTRVHERLAAIVGGDHVQTDRASRILHTRGKSTPDLLRIRAGEASAAPDAIVAAGSHDEVLALLAICEQEGLAVVPYGGGTSVVGGLAPRGGRFTAAIALDLRRLTRLLELDQISRTATLEAGLRGPEAEGLLAERGYTLGHFPQSFEYASLGGFAATRSSGQASAGYGRFDERVVGLRIATPRGTLELGRAPKSAAGPDLRQLFLGSEGAFGVITAVQLEITPLPEARVYDGWRVESFPHGIRALRRLAQDGPTPTILRLSDEAETALNLVRPTQLGSDGATEAGCLAITGYEGSESAVAERRDQVSEILSNHGAVLDRDAGEGWARDRYRGPYLRDALLDAGALAETLETATFWSKLETLYASVERALTDKLTSLGTPPVVLCHVSHTYRSGASLYFTVGAAQLDDPVAQWWAAKLAASDAILAAGGTITHHHGVGTDNKLHYARELGPLGVKVVKAVKATVDPHGILNPGILVD
jgi:alkyldihydroxyacetonephosphate synthase